MYNIKQRIYQHNKESKPDEHQIYRKAQAQHPMRRIIQALQQ